MGDTDRVRVPTNGHRPALEAVDADDGSPAAADPASPAEPVDPRIVFTPAQVAAGFGILAGLILLLVGTRRRGRRPDDEG